MKEATPVQLGFPTVYEGHFDFNKEVLIAKFEEIANSKAFVKNYMGGDHYPLEIGDAGSTAGLQASAPHTWPEMQKFKNYAIRQCKKILDGWGIPFKEVTVDCSWFNHHGKGGITNYHVHAGADIVLAAYVSAPENSGNLLMVDPLEQHWFGTKSLRLRSLLQGQEMPVADNTVYFFAPFIKHATLPNETDEDRWVISMNFSCR
jgi:uncharacterized protein (TIGR02466 family)